MSDILYDRRTRRSRSAPMEPPDLTRAHQVRGCDLKHSDLANDRDPAAM